MMLFHCNGPTECSTIIYTLQKKKTHLEKLSFEASQDYELMK